MTAETEATDGAESAGRDPEGSFREAQGGGSASHGPNPDPGGKNEPGGLVPPYEGRTQGPGESESAAAGATSVESQMAETDSGQPGATASPAVESPVEPHEVTDEVPDSPLGVGESTNRRGEDVIKQDGKEPGRDHSGTEGEAERPAGTSDARDVTGVNPQD
jgi:hypothetical protein